MFALHSDTTYDECGTRTSTEQNYTYESFVKLSAMAF